MAHDLSDQQRVLKLLERIRLLIAIDDEMPIEIKRETQPTLKLLEAQIGAEHVDEIVCARYFSLLYSELAEFPDLEALLSATLVFAPYLES